MTLLKNVVIHRDVVSPELNFIFLFDNEMRMCQCTLVALVLE